MTDIMVGSSHSVGTIECSGEHVTGEGGPVDPRLVVPLVVRLHRRPVAEQVAVLGFRISLHLAPPSSSLDDRNSIGPVVTTVGPSPVGTVNLPFLSLPDGIIDYHCAVRIPLTLAHITQLERFRHQAPNKILAATLRIVPEVAWVLAVGNSISIPNREEAAPLPNPFSSMMGMLVTYAHFWSVGACAVPLTVSSSAWITNVLPGLGYDSLRLIEIRLPPTGGALPSSIGSFFDDARRDYDAGRYRECIEKCRDVRNAIEQYLGATTKDHIAKVIGDRLGWTASAPQRAYLKGMWDGFAALTNAGHHIPAALQLTETDARTCVLTTATLCEYLNALLSPARRAP